MTGVLFFFVGVLTLAGIYAIFAQVLNLEAGWAGMWDLGLVGLVAVGGYTYIILTQTQNDEVVFAPGLPMWVGIIGAAAAGGLVAFVIGVPSLRVRGEFFLITTLAFAEVIHQLTINLNSVTRGTVGFNQIARPFESFVQGRGYRVLLLVLVWVIAGLVYLVMRRLANAPYGRLLRGFRDNDPVALSLGKHTNRHRIFTFVFAGVVYGGTAPLYVWFLRTATPSVFSAEVTFVAWTALVIGGIASKSGPVIGAGILLLITETVSLAQGSGDLAVVLSSARFIVLGLVLILVMRYRPEGLISEQRSLGRASQRMAKTTT
ncbi:MAG: branched-chain amino acid ABC transporter permease [Acidimicrobiia bacterium]|nr:branched-chain amino acid ABC transporter permease [Acidimicrobiia bacterium]